MTENTSWCYSFDNQNFRSEVFESEELAVQDAIKQGEDKDHVFVAPCKRAVNSQFYPDADLITEHMLVNAQDNYNEHADEYPDVSEDAEKELTRELHKLLDRWCKKHQVEPTFYMVGESKKVVF